MAATEFALATERWGSQSTVERDPAITPRIELPLGAHLCTPRALYMHHGVYVGNGRVIHYAGTRRHWPSGLVEQVSLEQFSNGHGIWIKPARARTFASTQIVERASSRLGERRYRLLTNNCEHFCEWCLRDKREGAKTLPKQAAVRNALLAIRNVGATLAFRIGRLRKFGRELLRDKHEIRAALLYRKPNPDAIQTVC